MGEKRRSKEDICEEIFRHYVGGNNFEAFLESQENALKNGCFPETLEKKDLPLEVFKRIKQVKIEKTQIYSKEDMEKDRNRFSF